MSGAVLKPSFTSPTPEPVVDLGIGLRDLVDAALSGDQDRVRRVAAALAVTYKGDDHQRVASHIRSALGKRTTPLDQVRSLDRFPVDSKSRIPLAEELPWPTTPLLMEDDQAEVVARFVAEARHADDLSRAGLGSRLSLLLSGPPGTGKTFMAGHIAARLGRPFHVVRLDSIISSLLGDTAKNIRSLFEFIDRGSGFIFIDEIDAVAKKRDDTREMGEIKRVVNTLIQALDILDGKTVVVAATNHAHLLDPAIFRRFPYYVEATLPDEEMRRALWSLYLHQDEPHPEIIPLAKISHGLSYSDIRELSLSARRTALVQRRAVDVCAVSAAVLSSEEGRLRLPTSKPLDVKSKRALTEKLVAMKVLTQKQVGMLTGVTRQAAAAKVRPRRPKE